MGAHRLMDTPRTPTIEELLLDPSTTYWFKDALQALMERDPVDAASDAELLAKLMRARCQTILGLSRPVLRAPRPS